MDETQKMLRFSPQMRKNLSYLDLHTSKCEKRGNKVTYSNWGCFLTQIVVSEEHIKMD